MGERGGVGLRKVRKLGLKTLGLFLFFFIEKAGSFSIIYC